jgi:lipoprotein-anchoring transpeptidase ErfK/SrfK
VTASFLVATSIAAFLTAPQGYAQRAVDLADVGRADSARVHASKPVPKPVAASPAVPAPVGPAEDPVVADDDAAPVPAPAAVPLPDVPLWNTPVATVPIPVAADWLTEMPGAFRADSIVVVKSERRMTLFYRGVPVKRYRVALGRNPVGDKVSIGDYRTPEGVFDIIGRNPDSKFYKSFEISYPDSAHWARADSLGVSPGGNIMIHGMPAHQAKLGAAHVLYDWTEGCIALTNAEIDEMWRAVVDGARIQIKP